MQIGKGRVMELILEDGCTYARINCDESLVPTPGQYVLASSGSDSLLPVPLFYTVSVTQGFIGSAPDWWRPGDDLYLRGPLGHGFLLPGSARKIGLVAFDNSPSHLRGLIPSALRQNASIVLLCETSSDHLPDEVEVQPLSALGEILGWADFLALDVSRQNLKEMVDRLGTNRTHPVLYGSQVLIRTSMPCGGIAECGVCALTTRLEWKMVCREGPVFNWNEI